MILTNQEAALIGLIRTLAFDVLLDATNGILTEADNCKARGDQLKAENENFDLSHFSRHVSELQQLATLLGEANEDFRIHMSADLEDQKVILIAHNEGFSKGIEYLSSLLDQGKIIKNAQIVGDGHQVLTVGFYEK